MDDTSIIYGLHAVEAILTEYPERVASLCYDRRHRKSLGQLLHVAAQASVQTDPVSIQQLDRLSDGAVHQGLVARMAPFAYTEFDRLLDLLKKVTTTPLVVALDHLQDPHNVGAITRTACALGAHGIIMPRRRACNVTATVLKVAVGAAHKIPLVRVTNFNQALQALSAENMAIVGLDAQAERSLWQADFNQPLVVVVGAEDRGIRHSTQGLCDPLISIPMPEGRIESLNASVASGIVLAEICRQRAAALQ